MLAHPPESQPMSLHLGIAHLSESVVRGALARPPSLGVTSGRPLPRSAPAPRSSSSSESISNTRQRRTANGELTVPPRTQTHERTQTKTQTPHYSSTTATTTTTTTTTTTKTTTTTTTTTTKPHSITRTLVRSTIQMGWAREAAPTTTTRHANKQHVRPSRPQACQAVSAMPQRRLSPPPPPPPPPHFLLSRPKRGYYLNTVTQ